MTSEIDRRPLLKGLFLAGVGALADAGPVLAGAPRSKALDLTNKEDLSVIARKLCYSMDDRLGFWHLSAIRYGLVGTKLFPFWEMHIGRFFTTHDREDGTYDVRQMGLTYYTDVGTGAYLRQFRNPLTGKLVEVQYETPKARRYAPPELVAAHYEEIDARGDEPSRTRNHELAAVGTLGPAWVQGDNIWIQQDHLLEYPSPQNVHGLAHVNDLTSYFGLLSEVADPSISMPRAGHAFSDINDWPAWLEMGEQPGVYYSRGIGFKVFSFEEMPAIWKTLALREHPVIARDALGALQGL